jgi:hypothetical protein
LNNRTAREVEINLGKDDRVIEIIGTHMRQRDIATVKEEEATEITSPPPTSPNTTNMRENVRNTNASLAGDMLLKLMNQLLIIQKKQHRHL